MDYLPEALQAPVAEPGNLMTGYGQDFKPAELTPITPLATNAINPVDEITAGFNKFANTKASFETRMAPVSFDSKRTNSDRYMNSDYYKELGFSLDKDNEEIYGQRQTWGNTIHNAAAGSWDLAASGFVDGWKGWGRMGSALVNMDWSKLAGSEEDLLALNDHSNKIMNENAIFSTAESDATFWNRKTFGNFLQQSGFTLGTIGQMVTEQALSKVVEALVFLPTVGVGSAAIEVATDLKGLNTVNQLRKLWTLRKSATALNEAGAVWKQKGMVEKALSAMKNNLPGFELAHNLNIAKDAGAGWKTLAAIGVGGIKRGLSEANLAMTEARMEAAGTYGDLYQKMYYEYVDKHGEAPLGEALEVMQKNAFDAGKDNFVFNSMLLSAMNRIQFDGMFKSFKNSSFIGKALNLGDDDINKVLQVKGKVGEKMLTQEYKKGFMGTLGLVGKIATDFGKKKAAWEVGKSLKNHILKWEVSEGVQELLQESSNNYFHDYYYDLYSPSKEADRYGSLDKAIDSQVNMQGLKTFMSGALTGMITSGPSKLVEKGMHFASTTKDQRKKYSADLSANVAERNTFFRNPTAMLSEINKSFKIQQAIAGQMDLAGKNKDKYNFENMKTASFVTMMAKAVRNNTHEALINTLKDYGTHLSKEEFEQAFNGIQFSDENTKDAKQHIDGIVRAAQSYVKTREALQEQYGDQIKPELFHPKTWEYKEASMAKARLDDMIDILASNEHKAKESLKRMTSIFDQAGAHPTFGATLADSFNIMGSEAHTKGELHMLQQEIKGLNAAPTKDKAITERLKHLTTQLTALEDWHNERNRIHKTQVGASGLHEVIDGNKNVLSSHATQLEAEDAREVGRSKSIEKMRAGFKAYFDSKNSASGITTTVSDKDLSDNFMNLVDYIKLNKQSQDHTDAFNTIINPKNFSKLHSRLTWGAKLASLRIQEEAITWGFAQANSGLMKRFVELHAIKEPTEEDQQEYYQLIEDLAKAANAYTDQQAMAYRKLLEDIIDNDQEFEDENKDLLENFFEKTDELNQVVDGSDEQKNLKQEAMMLFGLLMQKAQEFKTAKEVTITQPAATTVTATTTAAPIVSSATTTVDIKALEKEADALMDKGITDFRAKREELIKQGKTPDEATLITGKEWEKTADGIKYAELDKQIKAAKATSTTTVVPVILPTGTLTPLQQLELDKNNDLAKYKGSYGKVIHEFNAETTELKADSYTTKTLSVKDQDGKVIVEVTAKWGDGIVADVTGQLKTLGHSDAKIKEILGNKTPVVKTNPTEKQINDTYLTGKKLLDDAKKTTDDTILVQEAMAHNLKHISEIIVISELDEAIEKLIELNMDPKSIVYKFDIKILSDAIENRRSVLQKMIIFENVERNNIIAYTKDGVSKDYLVIKITDDEMQLTPFPNRANSTLTISKADFKTNTTIVYKNEFDYKTANPTDLIVTPEDVQTAAASAASVDTLFKDADKLMELAKEGKSMKVDDAFAALITDAGC